MKLVFLTSRFPYPIEKGDKLRAYHQIRYLAQSHEVILIALSDQPVQAADRQVLEALCEKVYLFQLPKWQSPFRLIRALFNNWPFQVAYFFRPPIRKQIKDIMEQVKPDRVICQLLRMAPYGQAATVPAYLDYMDSFSLGMQRRAEATPAWKRWLYAWEAHKLSRYEQLIYPHFSGHSIISEQDQQALNLPVDQPVRVLPNGVNTDFFQSQSLESPAVDLVFVGNMGYFPNVQAAQFLCRKVLPAVQMQRPETSLLLAGADPAPEVRQLMHLPGVQVSGRIPDIRTAYARGSIFVAPLFAGSGQQNKILEAMSMGKAVITTSLVNRSIGAEAPETICLADEADGFVTHILRLLKEERIRKEMGSQARAWVQAHYSWDRAYQQMADWLEIKP
ncbi:MAG: glycosyltransferase [Bacteroidota bacterium]